MEIEAKAPPKIQNDGKENPAMNKRASLSKFFRFKGLSGYPTTTSEVPIDQQPKVPKASTLKRIFNKKHSSQVQLNVSEKSAETSSKRHFTQMRSVVVPWLSRKVSQMSLNSKTTQQSQPSASASASSSSDSEIHEVLISEQL